MHINRVMLDLQLSKKGYAMTPKKDYVLYARSVKWLFWHSIQLGKGRALPTNI